MKRLTESNKRMFLAALLAGETVTKACQTAGISRRLAYYWKAEDEEFAGEWEEAQARGSEQFEDELRERALDRNDPRSHTLLMFLLKKLDPAFKESSKLEVSTKVEEAKVFDFSEAEREEAIRILRMAKGETE